MQLNNDNNKEVLNMIASIVYHIDNTLDIELVQAICTIESNLNIYAMRYEKSFEERYIIGYDIKRFGNQISFETEQKARATSWGLMQIMGQTARELGFDRQYLSELCNPEYGIKYGCMLLAKKVLLYGNQGLEAIVSAYNAGQPIKRNGIWLNKRYVDFVMQFMYKYKEKKNV